MVNQQIRFEAERDPKDHLRFYVTFPDVQLPKLSPRPLSLDISDAEQLLKAVKRSRAVEGSKTVMSGNIGQWLKDHATSNVALKEYSVSRKKAGTTPAHWRVGLAITFANPALAQAFAKVCNI